MQTTYHFAARLAADGTIIIPEEVRQYLPREGQLNITVSTDDLKQQASETEDDSLRDLIAQIQAMPPNPAMITPARASLAEQLQALSVEPDPDFDVETWNREWDAVEAMMNRSVNQKSPRRVIDHAGDETQGFL